MSAAAAAMVAASGVAGDAVAAAAAAAAGEIVLRPRASRLKSVSLISYCIENLRHRGEFRHRNNTELQWFPLLFLSRAIHLVCSTLLQA